MSTDPEHAARAAEDALDERVARPGADTPQDEPVTTGTVFIVIVFLMAMAGMWAIMYLTLLGR